MGNRRDRHLVRQVGMGSGCMQPLEAGTEAGAPARVQVGGESALGVGYLLEWCQAV